MSFPVCGEEIFGSHWLHRKRGRSARASPSPHHTLAQERTARFTAQPFSALAKRISTDFDKDIKTLETSFINAGYPKRFISHKINKLLKDSSQDGIIPNILFENERQFSSSSLFCGENEKLSMTFIAKLNKFNNFNFIFVILWQTRQIKKPL